MLMRSRDDGRRPVGDLWGLLGRLATGRPKITLLGVLLVTAILGAGLPRLTLRTDGAALHPLGSPAVALSEEDRVTFHDPEEIILLLSSRKGGPAVATDTTSPRVSSVGIPEPKQLISHSISNNPSPVGAKGGSASNPTTRIRKH